MSIQKWTRYPRTLCMLWNAYQQATLGSIHFQWYVEHVRPDADAASKHTDLCFFPSPSSLVLELASRISDMHSMSSLTRLYSSTKFLVSIVLLLNMLRF